MVSANDLLSLLNKLCRAVNIDEIKKLSTDAVEVDKTNAYLRSLSSFENLMKIWSNAVHHDKCSSDWSFVCLSLECLVRLKNLLAQEAKEENRLLSVADQKSVRTLLELVVTLGLLPYLLRFLQPPRTTVRLSEPNLTDIQKYERLCLFTLVLLELCQDDTFHGIVLPQFLLPLLCTLCQLTMTPLKKSVDQPRLMAERQTFQRHLNQLTEKLYQPMVIKQLMVIQGNKEGPEWLKRSVGKVLTDRLLRDGGVLATLQAVRDAANGADPNTTTHLVAVARVIVGSSKYDCVCPQILNLLDSSDAELSRMGVLCVRTLYGQDKSACEKHIFQPLTKPLILSNSTEEDVTKCIHRLHKCFAVPASDLWCLPSELLRPYIQILFQLLCKIHQSACFLKQPVDDLVWRFLSKCDDKLIEGVFKCLLYQKSIPGERKEVDFCFGEDGGVRTTQRDYEAENSLESFGDCLMVLLENRDTNGRLRNKLFVALLKFATEPRDMDTIGAIEEQLLNMKLLVILSGNPSVQENLSENPEPAVKYLSSMIADFLSGAKIEVEFIRVALVVVDAIVNDCIFSKKTCWKIFSQLEQSLFLLKDKATDAALRALAEGVYEAIVTRGAMSQKTDCSKKTKKENVKVNRSCELALREACDPLLPVRGHAIMQLGKLLASKDLQARVKKDQILCIFQENLKQEDSFLYLSAIESLALAAAEFPDSAIMILTEQFTQCSLSVENRLKVGEALVRVIRHLGELVPAYKADLFNAFFLGTRDKDHLIRASSLSGLGELCLALGFRVAPLLAEVLECANACVQFDPHFEVRRAAVLLITLLIKGLRSDMISVLEDVLKTIYSTLKSLHATDSDDIVRLHAQLGLEELSRGMMEFLFPKLKLEKSIFVLNPS